MGIDFKMQKYENPKAFKNGYIVATGSTHSQNNEFVKLNFADLTKSSKFGAYFLNKVLKSQNNHVKINDKLIRAYS